MSVYAVGFYLLPNDEEAEYTVEYAAMERARTTSDWNANRNLLFAVRERGIVKAVFVNGRRFDPHED